MACMTLFAQPLAMATTQLAQVVRYQDSSNLHIESKTERSPLHMSWVVVTDGGGKSQLRVCWTFDR